MPAGNSEQIAEWNGALGQRWVAMREEIDRVVVPFGDAALKAAAPQPGERVIDVGCGCGDTSIEIAQIVGAAGAVLGIDVSRPMLAILSRAGFGAIEAQRFDVAISMGATPRSAAESVVQIGPVSRLVREVGAEHLPIILDAVERALAPLAAPDGHVSLNGSTWIVSAKNPA